MEGNDDNKCPLCGKETQDGEKFCRDCQEIARNDEDIFKEENKEQQGETIKETEPNSPDKGNITEPQEVMPQKKRSKKLLIFFFIGLFVCTIAGGVGAYITKQAKQSKETEIAFWDSCIEENTTLAYSKYLVRFPDGLFSEEAQNKIRELKAIEDSTWVSLSQSNSIDKLHAYLNDYPASPYRRQIRKRVDSLSWLIYSKENTAAAYKTYLENINLGSYEGKYQVEAQKRYDYLSSLKIVEGDELIKLKKELKQVFKLLSEEKYTELQKNIPDTLAVFYDQKNKKVSQIIDSLKADNKQKKIKSIAYSINTDNIEVIKDMHGRYYTGFAIVKQFTYTSKKKKKDSIKLSIQVELDENMQIQAIYKEKKKFP